MADFVITSTEQATPELLTAVLSSSGALTSGTVTAVELDQGSGNWSTNARLRVSYSHDATGHRPNALFLKLVNTDLDDDESFGSSEVDYYVRDYADVPDAPLMRCYDAAYSPTEHRYHLLLDDVTGTHVEATGRQPGLEYALALADGFASLHARWWGAERLSTIGRPIHDAAHVQRFVDIAATGVEHVLDHETPDLAVHWPDLIRQIFSRHPKAMINRTEDPDGHTIIHGDPGCTNILVPRDGHRPIYLIDRQPFDWSLTTWLGVFDIVYATVLDWPVAARRGLETPLLRRYHQQLVAHGVTSYSWDQLWADYRLTIPVGVYIAVEYNRGGHNADSRWVWLPYLQRTLTAFDDLDCAALL